ncbi:MAG TPA: signal peptidase I [Acidimicrobiales bacterium]|nr:signal peptidase I [Acidimicrobiales bacterium]
MSDDQTDAKPRRWVKELVAIVLFALVIAIVLRTFVIGTYSIPSGSMEPTLQVNDRILVDKLSYDLHGVGRGDIVVFATPKNEDCAGPKVANLVKRVIGLPGDTISLVQNEVDVNGRALPEPWLSAQTRHNTYPGPSSLGYALHEAYRVPAHDVYVMGDNRMESCDSRYWGPIPESSIVGKVDVRIWPLTRFHIF